MDKAILFRKGQFDQYEYDTAEQYFDVITGQRTGCFGQMVIGRYSVLPYYKELVLDLEHQNCRLINSFKEHLWIATSDYYEVVKDFTIPIWRPRELERINYDGPFVVKGETNSRKHDWNTMMFAKDRAALIEVMRRLHKDGLVGTQKLIVRPFVELVTLETGLNDLPFTEEWRFFYLGNNLLTHGYYWSEADKADEYNEQCPNQILEFAAHVASLVSPFVNFFVLDIALKKDGEPILIEINDGQMSGLSMCKPDELYFNLEKTLDETY